MRRKPGTLLIKTIYIGYRKIEEIKLYSVIYHSVSQTRPLLTLLCLSFKIACSVYCTRFGYVTQCVLVYVYSVCLHMHYMELGLYYKLLIIFSLLLRSEHTPS